MVSFVYVCIDKSTTTIFPTVLSSIVCVLIMGFRHLPTYLPTYSPTHRGFLASPTATNHGTVQGSFEVNSQCPLQGTLLTSRAPSKRPLQGPLNIFLVSIARKCSRRSIRAHTVRMRNGEMNISSFVEISKVYHV